MPKHEGSKEWLPAGDYGKDDLLPHGSACPKCGTVPTIGYVDCYYVWFEVDHQDPKNSIEPWYSGVGFAKSSSRPSARRRRKSAKKQRAR